MLGAIRKLIGKALPQVLGARRLPQTGQLWWPVPILLTAGILLFVSGLRDNLRKRRDGAAEKAVQQEEK